jgi:hypothetical protein
VEEAVEALMCAVDTGARVWTPFTESITVGIFRQRIKDAMAGRLEPVDHVKSLDRVLQSDLFEIRWQNVEVVERDLTGHQVAKRVHVRLIHCEPQTFPHAVVGLHAHEKVVFPGDNGRTREAQQRDIGKAVAIYGDEARLRWAIYQL